MDYQNLPDKLCKVPTEEMVEYVRRFLPDASEEECIDRFLIYTSYREEGQTILVSRQYAGLL